MAHSGSGRHDGRVCRLSHGCPAHDQHSVAAELPSRPMVSRPTRHTNHNPKKRPKRILCTFLSFIASSLICVVGEKKETEASPDLV
ncbi:hypothetical protein [Pandoravirus japonicus]|uniref:Uncharacterized protein n=1 Tax=Pandoravirus japonicus TaxID=2823154 RepID=A0A811BP35_9VIRU|nr:hypothetical protein [Pandoravirus japonicus]